MSTTPEPDAELDHVVKHLFDVELERLAFGRPQTDAEQQLASAAAAELGRRAADGPARRGETDAEGNATATRATPTPTLKPATRRLHSAAPRSSSSTRIAVDRERDDRPWWRRSWAIITAGVLVVVGVTSIPPALTPSSDATSSLDVFAREVTAAERELGTQLQREGLLVSISPRVVAERDDAQILAYRYIVTSPGERGRNEVCLLLLDVNALGLPTCVNRVSFVTDGMLATLSGQERVYVVQWGPTGAPRVSVLPPDDPPPQYPESRAAQAFFESEQTTGDRVYTELLRQLHPDDRLMVRVIATTPTWYAVGALVAAADTGRWSYCVHLFQPATDLPPQLGANVTCAAVSSFERDGLVAQARTGDGRLLIEWQPDDTVMVSELAAP